MNKRIGDRIAYVLVLLAVASAIGLQFRWNQQVVFAKAMVAIPQHRGPDGSAKPAVFTETQLAQLVDVLQDTVAESFTKLRPRSFDFTFGPRTEFRIGTSLQELFEGGIGVDLRVYNFKDQSTLKVWTREFDSEQAFRDGAAAFAQEIAQDMAAR